MSEPKFTKGPWTSFLRKTDPYIMYPTCFIYSPHSPRYIARTENKDDANLIACAPEMYEMLENLAEGLRLEGGYAHTKEINELLAKCRGEK